MGLEGGGIHDAISKRHFYFARNDKFAHLCVPSPRLAEIWLRAKGKRGGIKRLRPRIMAAHALMAIIAFSLQRPSLIFGDEVDLGGLKVINAAARNRPLPIPTNWVRILRSTISERIELRVLMWGL